MSLSGTGKDCGDTADAMKAVHDLFRAELDCSTIGDVKVLQTGIEDYYAKREQETRSHIKALTTHIKETQYTAGKEELIAVREKIEWLQNEQENSLQAVNELKERKKSLKERSESLAEEGETLAKNAQKLRNSHPEDTPKVIHALGLYKNISRVKWDYNATTMKGVITRRTGVYPFNYQKVDFDSTNALWDLIAAAGRSR